MTTTESNSTIKYSSGHLYGYAISNYDKLNGSATAYKENAVIDGSLAFSHLALIVHNNRVIFNENDNDTNWIIATLGDYRIISTPIFSNNNIDLKSSVYTITKLIITTPEDENFIMRDVNYDELLEFIKTI